jgi:hypothetical protein
VTLLKDARALIERKHVPRGYGAVEALFEAAGPGSPLRIIGPFMALADSARRLFNEPEPTVVSDVLGKEATLRMFDDAIAQEGDEGMAGVPCAVPPHPPHRPPMTERSPLSQKERDIIELVAQDFMNKAGGGSSSGGTSGSGSPLPSYPRPRLEECPTRRRRTPRNPDLKASDDAA